MFIANQTPVEVKTSCLSDSRTVRLSTNLFDRYPYADQ